MWRLSVLFVAVLASEVRCSGVAPPLKLNNGKDMPSLGLGTWLGFTKSGDRVQLKSNEVEQAVEWAIDAGYRHIDTAHIYNTEEQKEGYLLTLPVLRNTPVRDDSTENFYGDVGKAINKKLSDGVVKREELFITTKLWNDKHAKEAVVPALRDSLEKLGLDYIDLFLIHWPIALSADGSLSEIDYLETWQGMIEAQNLGLTKSIGVSNFNQKQLDRLISLSSVIPQVLQVEVNLNLQQPSLLDYCRSQNITVTGYTPFGSLFYSKAAADAPLPRVDSPELVAIAEKYNKTVPQVNLRYLVELGVIPIPKSTTKSRVEQNIAVFDFHLTEEEKTLLKGYDRNYRTIPVRHWSTSQYYPFEK